MLRSPIVETITREFTVILGNFRHRRFYLRGVLDSVLAAFSSRVEAVSELALKFL